MLWAQLNMASSSWYRLSTNAIWNYNKIITNSNIISPKIITKIIWNWWKYNMYPSFGYIFMQIRIILFIPKTYPCWKNCLKISHRIKIKNNKSTMSRLKIIENVIDSITSCLKVNFINEKIKKIISCYKFQFVGWYQINIL
jgi:hypothetical protein